MNDCKRGCCWTPHGVCARKRTCTHHEDAEETKTIRQMQETARLELQLEGRRR